MAIANARRVRSSVDHAVRWGDETRGHDALSVLFPRAASIRSSGTGCGRARGRGDAKGAGREVESRCSMCKSVIVRSSGGVAGGVNRDVVDGGRLEGLKEATGLACKTGIGRRRIAKRASWLPILPADVLERVVRMFAARATLTETLQVAKASEELARAVVAVADYTFEIDECTLPNIAQWATIFRTKVRTLRVHRRLRRYPRDIVLPALRTLIAARCLEDVTVPAVPLLLRALAYLPNLRTLGVYIRNQEDAMTLLTMGGAAIGSAVERRNDGRVVLQRGAIRRVRIRWLRIHCVQHDDAKDDPFCFTNACALDHLTCNDTTTGLFRCTFSTVTKVSVDCHHRLSCDAGRLLTALPLLSHVEITAPVDMTDVTRDVLLKMRSVRLCGVPGAALHAATLGARMKSLRTDDVALTRAEVRGLWSCTGLEDVRVLLSAGAEESLYGMEFGDLRKLEIRWGHTIAEVYSEESQRVCTVARLHEPCGRALQDAVRRMPRLESVALEHARLGTRTVRGVLRGVGGRLREFGTSLEGQKAGVGGQLECILRVMSEDCCNVRRVVFCEAGSGSGAGWRYGARLGPGRADRLKASLALVKSRARGLDVRDVQTVVDQVCGDKVEEHCDDWGA